MLEGFFVEAGKKISDRWMASVLLPGLLFLAIAACAASPGRHGPIDLAAIAGWFDRLLYQQYPTAAGRTTLFVVVMISAAATALLMRWAGIGIARLWLGQTRWLPWRRATPPRWSTRISEHLRRVEQYVNAEYGVAMALVWPRLWQITPDGAKREIQAAWDRYASATIRAAWALPYLALAVAELWWPGLLIALGLSVTAWLRASSAIRAFSQLVEATVDTQLRTLADVLGVLLPHSRVMPAQGAIINELLNKGRTVSG
ncbi:hypothetical protein Lfu02_69360 [Longispora fulva]|uniref:Uncharacterized protein n=1 Tax=Longispora fulva TaxID=619741 RepID=A0A8J7G7K7_9ACTN|nr:hypothetical protein [Longispora fulva]MBG6134525.1 hypothetical protein [Longispora fulva]GIG62564.1 hypothetical protein Lfu02_69360 [Longispora fulva]